MHHDEFWRIIDAAREEAGGWEGMYETLPARLRALDLPDLMLWKRIFDEYQRLSYKNKLWAAAYIINGGCSDDAFDYFRAWLTAQGKAAFLNALKNPETLAEADAAEEDVGFEDILYAPAQAYFCKLKLPPDDLSANYDALHRELDKHPLPPETKAAMAAEIVYDEDIDAEWTESDLPGLLPRLCKKFAWDAPDCADGSEAGDEARARALEAGAEKAVAYWLSLAPEARIRELEEWHSLSEHSLIVRAVEALPAEERDYALTSLYARALNNLDREAEGLAALLSVKDEGENDGLWHFRVAYALYYTKRATEALPHVTRALELGDHHPGTHQLLAAIKKDLGMEDDAGDGKTQRNAHLFYHCVACGREQGFEGLCYFCRTEAERERYQKMPDDELRACVAAIIGDIQNVPAFKKSYDDFIGLLSCRDINTEAIARAAFENGVFYPPQIYRDASADVRDGLLRLLEKPDFPEANNLLQCLAEIGDRVVAEAFRRFDADPPPWREKLYVSAVQYLQCADRAADENGEIIPLYFEPCYEFVADRATDRRAARIGGRLQEFCAHCGCELVNLLEIDGDSEQLAFLGLSGMGTVSVPVCPNCAGMSERILVRRAPDGSARMEIIEPFGNENYFDEDALSRLTAGRLTLSTKPAPPYLNFCPQEVATIGGRGNWVQDAQFEDCPDCGRKMKLFAQLSWDKLLDDYAEGRLFAEICPDCKTIAVLHQQT
jgi:hypothetical protein